MLLLLLSRRSTDGFAVAGIMPELTEIDATKKTSFEDPKKDAAADSDSDSSGADAAAVKSSEGASGPVTAEELSTKARQSRGEKKARKIISKLGLKQVRGPLCHEPCVKRYYYLLFLLYRFTE